MEKKVGRNDPCPCGSGKKYKQCHMAQEEESVKTYTPQGKRKFKATVISSTDKTTSIFQGRPAAKTMSEASPHVFLKVKQTEIDYRTAYEPATTPFPILYPWNDVDFEMPERALGDIEPPPENYALTSADYRV